MSCRVCFEVETQKLPIFDNIGRQKHIAEILEKHLWFAPSPADTLSKFICVKCWTKIYDFHEFYETVKRMHDEKCKELENSTSKIQNFTENLESDLSKLDESLQNDFYVTVLVDEIDFYENETVTEVTFERDNNKSENQEQKEVGSEHIQHESLPNELAQLSQESTNNAAALPKLKRKRNDYSRATAEDQIADQILKKHILLNCEICNYKAETFYDIIKHFASDHPNTRAYVNCCGRRFTKRERLIQHAWLHEDPKHFQCPICKRVFRDNEIKTAHMKAQHPTEEELIHHCDQCEKRFARAYLLKLHKAVHVPVEERQFFCNKCQTPKAFASQNQLNIHNSMSHNRLPNICDVCGKTIRDRQAFLKHVRLHFEESGPRVKCPQPGCESWLKDKDNLKQHLRRHNRSSELLQCDECYKLCKDRRALTCHKRSVHPTTMFSCEICGKLLKKSISLKEHMATHTGEALYECPFCTQKFKSNANMHAHKKKMHPAEWEICKNLKNR